MGLQQARGTLCESRIAPSDFMRQNLFGAVKAAADSVWAKARNCLLTNLYFWRLKFDFMYHEILCFSFFPNREKHKNQS